MSLESTIRNIRQEVTFSDSEVAVLFTPALTRYRYISEQWWLIRETTGKEFIYLQKDLYPSWNIYKREVVYKCKQYLDRIDNGRTYLVLSGKFADFKKTLKDDSKRLIILIAHHHQSIDKNFVEFADRAVDIKYFEQAVKSVSRNRPFHLILIACGMQSEALGLYNHNIPNLQSVGYANWQMPLISSLEFVSELVAAFQVETSLHKAYDVTVRKMLSQ